MECMWKNAKTPKTQNYTQNVQDDTFAVDAKVMWFKAIVLCEDESCLSNAAKIHSRCAVVLLKNHDPKLYSFFGLRSVQATRNTVLQHVKYKSVSQHSRSLDPETVLSEALFVTT